MIQAQPAQACSFPALLERVVELNWLEGGGKSTGRVCTPKAHLAAASPVLGTTGRQKSLQIGSQGVFSRRGAQPLESVLQYMQLEHQVPPKT